MAPEDTFQFGSSPTRLTAREWLVVAAVLLAVVMLAPLVWRANEPFSPAPDYRVPQALGNDYWHFQTWAKHAARQADVLLLGDSVVWGQYVRPGQTLPAALTARADGVRFANLGLGGATPAALAGLVRHYAGAVAGCKVLLHFNPLWLSSARTEMRASPTDDEDAPVNHPDLIAQFDPRLTAYRQGLDGRLAVAIERHVPLLALKRHVQIKAFDNLDLQTWSLANPYAAPLSAIRRPAPAAADASGSVPIPWRRRGLPTQDHPWGELVDSLQWESFRDTHDLLRGRGNDVFVLVGPLNTHMLTHASRQRFDVLEAACLAWLQQAKIPHAAPGPLPTDQYADASHPLAAGYNMLANQLLAHKAFRRWLR